MTNLEAANLLDNLIGMISDNHDSDYDEALSKGRDILKSEPCEDCISRQVVKDLYYKNGYIDFRKICELPPVTPQPKTEWIPVSERLPKEEGSYMTTLDYGEYGLSVGQRYYHGEDIGWNDECVIAWMPLPESYKGDRYGICS